MGGESFGGNVEKVNNPFLTVLYPWLVMQRPGVRRNPSGTFLQH
jgi:hypothetical protein